MVIQSTARLKTNPTISLPNLCDPQRILKIAGLASMMSPQKEEKKAQKCDPKYVAPMSKSVVKSHHIVSLTFGYSFN